MSGKIRVVAAAFMITVSIFTLTGCAAAWFLAGAGTAGTVAAVANSHDDDTVK